MGEGLTFTPEEKAKAATSPQVHIQYFQGVLGNVSDSHVVQNLDMRVQAGDMQSLKKHFASIGLTETDINALEVAIKNDPTPANRDKFGPQVSSWIGAIYTKIASGTYSLAIGTAGSLIANAIWQYYSH